ncbi:hypothetical protein ETD83_41305 [Actinomadura soli]|uniref:N-acetyltransferase domain-containing protein n=1 Tax=Actinomadura soli TaxID=2508997 RepID=A0A5C4IYA1_9ACTN|nr:hypothetical protein [Actinomadura soli]TMQ82553.1 hypothetical protein ETD83_41305 [Actinomadura soli]
MGIDVIPFEERFVAPAAELLAADHAPAGKARLELCDVDVASRLVSAWHDTGPAIAVVDDGTLLGFVAATPADRHDDQHSSIRLHQHASAPRGKREIYRRLYRALAGQLIDLGGFEHAIALSASHHDVVTSLFELGFGIDQIKGLRATSSPIQTVQATQDAQDARDVQVRQANANDLKDLLSLTVELQKFHAGPPALRPALFNLRSRRARTVSTCPQQRSAWLP